MLRGRGDGSTLLLDGDADLEEGNRRRSDAAERLLERGEGHAAEDDLAEAGPEAEPPAGEDSGAGEAGEDEEGQLVGG